MKKFFKWVKVLSALLVVDDSHLELGGLVAFAPDSVGSDIEMRLSGGNLAEVQNLLGKVLLHGGAAIGTAGISILAKGLLDRVANSVPLCEKMLQQVQQQ